MTVATEILNTAALQHHCAAKLDGMIVALSDAGAGNCLVAVIDQGAVSKLLPLMPEEMARRAYWELVAALNTLSLAA